MENKIVGAIFCFMSAVLISARYISLCNIYEWSSFLGCHFICSRS